MTNTSLVFRIRLTYYIYVYINNIPENPILSVCKLRLTKTPSTQLLPPLSLSRWEGDPLYYFRGVHELHAVACSSNQLPFLTSHGMSAQPVVACLPDCLRSRDVPGT